MARDRGRQGGRREDYGSEDFRNRDRRYGSGQGWDYRGQQSAQGFSGRQQSGEGGWGGSDYEDRGYGQMSGQDDWSRRNMGGGQMGGGMGGGSYGSGSYYGSREPYGGSNYGRGYEGDFRGQSFARDFRGMGGGQMGGQMGGGMGGQMGSRYGGGERGFVEGGRYGGERGYGERGYGERGGRDFWDKAGDEVASWLGDEEAAQRRRQDQHRGRGPRGYKRSDERIREDINDRLTDDWMLDASDINVMVQSCEVTLNGEVGSREDKRCAEDIAESVSGVSHVQNNLRVRQHGVQSGMGQTRMGSSIGPSGSTGSTSGSTATASTSESGSKSTRKS